MPPRPTVGKDSLITDEDEVLQAVILADSFNKRFRPLTIRKPRCLLPVCNAPLLDWTFESLALAGVQEVFVVCRSHAEQIKTAIEDSKWSKLGSGMKIVPIVTAKETFSPGDAMRDIYTRGLVTTDFILVMGDLVSNIRIDEVVRLHKERRKTNKDTIMTIVVKESGAIHRTRPIGDSAVFALDSRTSECLHYQPVIAHPPTRFVQIPKELLTSHPEIDIRYDLIDCGIDVCSVEVPSLFQDNFDYLDIRRDFVHGILTSDLLMKNIYCHIATEGYAARVKDTKSYDSVSKDILSRWTFPLVPDDNYPGSQRYEHVRGNRYLAKDNTVVLARTCKIGTNTLIGSSTRISEDVQIYASVIGENCIIGAGTIIKNCYIFDHTTIGANCVLEKSIVGSNVNVKHSSSLPRGCLVADSVIIGPGAKLEPFDRLSTRRSDVEAELPDEDVDSDVEEMEAGYVIVLMSSRSNPDGLLDSGQSHVDRNLGHDSNALVWPHGPLSEEDEEGPENEKNLRFMRIGDDCSDIDISDPGTVSSESESESSGSESEDDTGYDTTASSDVLPPVRRDANESEFRSEAKQSLVRAFSEGHSIENASVELKTLRMAFDVPLSLAREAVISAVIGWIPVVKGGGAPQRQEIARVIDRWGNMINEIGGVDPVETVTLLQTTCASSDRMPLFGQILAALYQSDIVEEDDIRAWHALPASKGEGQRAEENLKKCWMIGSHMLQQFDAQESEESESEGGDNDSE